MRLLLEVASVETSRGVLPSVSLLVFWGEISAKKQGSRKGNEKGHRGLEAAVDGWRVGNAGDTIAVVIISGLPVCVMVVAGGWTPKRRLRPQTLSYKSTAFFSFPQILSQK